MSVRSKLFRYEYVTPGPKGVTYFLWYRLAFDLVVIHVVNFIATTEYVLLGYVDPEAKSGRKTPAGGVVSGE